MNKDGTLNVEGDLKETIKKLEQRIKELEAELVQRDVYEAEQRLPPEHAVLIKHLATVERCINEGPVTYHYAEESDCSFCGEWQGHTRDCAWFALQFERGVTSVIDDIHAVALREHERRESAERVRRMCAIQEVRVMTATEAALRARQHGKSDMIDALRYGIGVHVNPLVPPGTAYLTNLSDFRGIPALRQEPAQLVHGEWPDRPQTDEPVAPPDDEDVP